MQREAKARKSRVLRERGGAYKTAKRSGLTRREEKAIADFRARLHQVLRDDQIHSLILFGSKARGEAHRRSDVDLLLVHDDLSHEQKETLADLTADLFAEAEHPVLLHVLRYPADEFAQKAEIGTPLLVNIAREGKILEGAPIMVNETNRLEVAKSFLVSARERLDAAQVLLDSGHYRDSISRSYYAVLDAADAALIAKGFTPRSHTGSITLFGTQFIKTGLIDKRFGRLFHHMKDARGNADYERRTTIFTKGDAAHWLVQAREFVSAIETLLPTLLGDAKQSARNR